MNFNFKRKNVFLSGATHGIGLDCIINFAKLGANVITFSRDKNKINSKNIFQKINKKITL